ncbi:MAG: serine/threonine protein kinase, partial [Muribaculaceae bacterium]|nr:serine/threonine protein kinase [Muribaculaceae bacterium]
MIPNSIEMPAEPSIAAEGIELFKIGTRNVLWLTVREGRRFILKGLPEELRSHPEETARLRKEYSLGIRINHPGVAGVYGFEMHPAVGPVIVMEYVDGVTLDMFLSNGNKQDLNVRVNIARQLADALAYMHSMGVSHRDLKPDNILVTRRNEAKIIDIGLGDSEDSVIYKQSIGTEVFGAPEQQIPYVGDSRADVYSFGKLLGLLLPERKFRKMRSRCLNGNPAKRIAMHEVVDTLDAIMKPRKRGFWQWVMIFYGVMIGLGLIFGILDEVILKKEVADTEIQEQESVEISQVEKESEPEDATIDASDGANTAIKAPVSKNADKIEMKKPEEQTASDNSEYVAIYDKYMAEINEVLKRDYEPGMDKEAAMSLMSSKSVELANILGRMV